MKLDTMMTVSSFFLYSGTTNVIPVVFVQLDSCLSKSTAGSLADFSRPEPFVR
jgi:hypothetical protein